MEDTGVGLSVVDILGGDGEQDIFQPVGGLGVSCDLQGEDGEDFSPGGLPGQSPGEFSAQHSDLLPRVLQGEGLGPECLENVHQGAFVALLGLLNGVIEAFNSS